MNNDNDIRLLFTPLREEVMSDAIVARVKSRVFAEVARTPISTQKTPARVVSPISPFSLKVFMSACAVVLVLVGGITQTSLKIPAHTALTSVRMLFATNAYERSQLQLADMLYRMTYAVNHSIGDSSLALADSVSATRATLDQLQLMGEPGKYSMEECLTAYHTYYRAIDALTDAVPPESTGSLATLRTVLQSAVSEAEARIGKYPEGSKILNE